MFAVLLTGSLVLAACGDGDNDVNESNNVGGDNNADNNVEENNSEGNNEGNDEATGDVNVGNLQLGTGSTGGTYYPLGTEMATVISNNIDVDGFDLSAVSSGASVDNIVNIFQGEMHLDIYQH